MTHGSDTRKARMALAATLVAVAGGTVALVVGTANVTAVPAVALESGVVRAAAPDLAWPDEGIAQGARFEPPWTRGVPESRIVLTRGAHPRPVGAFAVELEREGWVRWGPVDAQTRPAAAPDRVRLNELLPKAEVRIVGPGGAERPCDRWMFGRWHCGPDDWNYVGETTVVVRDRPQECIWAHPVDGALVIRFADVPRGATLTGKHMLSDIAAQSDVPGDITLDIRVDGESVSTRTQALRRGLATFRVALPEGPELMDLEFEITAETTAQRHFCFDGSIRDFPEEVEQ